MIPVKPPRILKVPSVATLLDDDADYEDRCEQVAPEFLTSHVRVPGKPARWDTRTGWLATRPARVLTRLRIPIQTVLGLDRDSNINGSSSHSRFFLFAVLGLPICELLFHSGICYRSSVSEAHAASLKCSK